MALEFRGVIPEAHEGTITAVAYSHTRREFFTGSADNLIKCWDTETGRLVRSLSGHKGWVTHLMYMPEYRQLLSSSIDGRIFSWFLKPGNTQSKHERVEPVSLIEEADIGTPIQCLVWVERRKTLISATDGSINLYELSYDDRRRRIALKFMQKVRLQNDLIRQLLVVDDQKVFAVRAPAAAAAAAATAPPPPCTALPSTARLPRPLGVLRCRLMLGCAGTTGWVRQADRGVHAVGQHGQ